MAKWYHDRSVIWKLRFLAQMHVPRVGIQVHDTFTHGARTNRGGGGRDVDRHACDLSKNDAGSCMLCAHEMMQTFMRTHSCAR